MSTSSATITDWTSVIPEKDTLAIEIQANRYVHMKSRLPTMVAPLQCTLSIVQKSHRSSKLQNAMLKRPLTLMTFLCNREWTNRLLINKCNDTYGHLIFLIYFIVAIYFGKFGCFKCVSSRSNRTTPIVFVYQNTVKRNFSKTAWGNKKILLFGIIVVACRQPGETHFRLRFAPRDKMLFPRKVFITIPN